jgi:hypothetical protein
VAFDGYNGGMGCDIMQWTEDGINEFRRDTESLDGPYRGKSIVVLAFPTIRVKDKYLGLKLLQRRAGAGRGGAGHAGEPGPEDQAEGNRMLDLERVLRKIAGVNPVSWNRPERLLDNLLLDCKSEFSALKLCMHCVYTGDPIVRSFDDWKTVEMHPLNRPYEVEVPIEDGAVQPFETVGPFIEYLSHINHLHSIAGKMFQTQEALFLFCIARLVTVYMMQSVFSCDGKEYSHCVQVNNELDRYILQTGDVTTENMRHAVHHLQVHTNVNCHYILESIYYSGRDAYWDWLEFLYSDENKAPVNEACEIPNPLILPKMFSPESDPQVFVDSESTIPISDSSRYDLSRFLRNNMTKSRYAGMSQDSEAYKRYKEQLETMFTAQVNITPGENIRANTTQIPTLCYHGNMKVKHGGAVVDEIKCIGHMGNRYPGMASIREGRGQQTMNATAQIMHLQ